MTYHDIPNDDGTVTRWRNGVATVYNSLQEASVAERETPMQQWERRVRALQLQARSLIIEARALAEYADDNGVPALIGATVAGELVSGSTINEAQAKALLEVFGDLNHWIAGQATNQPDGTPRRAVINRD